MSVNRNPSRRLAIESKCHDCMAAYEDGKKDCEVVVCPLYAFMPYRQRTPNTHWQQYSPRRVGLVSWDDIHKQKHDKNDDKTRLNDSKGVPPTETIQAPEKSQKAVFSKQEMGVSP